MPMQLGASIFSPGRWQLGRLAMFAAWRDEAAIEEFLEGTPLGRTLAEGWHVRLRFLRRWGLIRELDGLPAVAGETCLDAPVVAVTLARLKLLQAPRFIRWGKPVERLVRDHPGTTLALAAARPMRTLCTFSVWRSAREMANMVHGRGSSPGANRHAVAMAERGRKSFHTEFTTLRFASIGEYGAWEGGRGFVSAPELAPPPPGGWVRLGPATLRRSSRGYGAAARSLPRTVSSTASTSDCSTFWR